MSITTATPSDFPAIHALVCAAFDREDEAALVSQLRADGAVAIEHIYCDDGSIMGHCLWSAMRAPEGALGLAPVSVSRAHQNKGIGRSLIQAGMEEARAHGYAGAFVLGDPAYYQRFGFSLRRGADFATPYPRSHFMAVDWAGLPPRGDAIYASAFAS